MYINKRTHLQSNTILQATWKLDTKKTGKNKANTEREREVGKGLLQQASIFESSLWNEILLAVELPTSTDRKNICTA